MSHPEDNTHRCVAVVRTYAAERDMLDLLGKECTPSGVPQIVASTMMAIEDTEAVADLMMEKGHTVAFLNYDPRELDFTNPATEHHLRLTIKRTPIPEVVNIPSVVSFKKGNYNG